MPNQPWGLRLIKLCRYDFDVDGGAQGAITPATRHTLPDGAVVLQHFVRAITALAGGAGSTVALDLSGGDALLAATAIASLDKAAGVPNARSGDVAGENVKVTVGAADLTAGVFDVFGLVAFPAAA